MASTSTHLTSVHHVTYAFNCTGLTTAECLRHVSDAKDKLSAHFGIERDAVRASFSQKNDHDVHVMRGRGNSPDYSGKVAAMRLLMPLFVGLTTSPSDDGGDHQVRLGTAGLALLPVGKLSSFTKENGEVIEARPLPSVVN